MNQQLQNTLHVMRSELRTLVGQMQSKESKWVAEQLQRKLSLSHAGFAADMYKHIRICDYETDAIDHFQADLTIDVDWNEFNALLEPINTRIYQLCGKDFDKIWCQTRSIGLAAIFILSGCTEIEFVGYGSYIDDSIKKPIPGHVWIRVKVGGRLVELDAMTSNGEPSARAKVKRATSFTEAV
jgi:hypothetical protein